MTEFKFDGDWIEQTGVKWRCFQYGAIDGTIHKYPNGSVAVTVEVNAKRIADKLREEFGQICEKADIVVYGIDYT